MLNMDSLSSSFLSYTFAFVPTISASTTTPPFSPYLLSLNVSSVSIEAKPPTPSPSTSKTSSSPRSTPNVQPSKIRTPLSSPSTFPRTTKPPKVTKKSTPSTPKTSVLTRTLPYAIFNAFDEIINNFIDLPLKISLDPRHVLSQNFAPVDELPPTECEITHGSLPPCLDGAYIRNGPNPQYLPRGPYHLFDGDGMLHSIRISQGKATLCSRYVKTYKYEMEHKAGHSILPSVFSGFNSFPASAFRGALFAARVFSGHYSPANGTGLANTSLAFFGNKLYALGESDCPYSVKLTSEGDIQTLGREDFDGKLFLSMSAHPKIDADTKEAFGFRYGPIPPFLTYFRFDANGNKQPDVPIFSMTYPSLLHDFAVTKKYAIFVEIQLKINPMEMIFGGGSPVGSDLKKISRLGVLPRYAKDESEIKWFDVPGFNIIHAINAWDEEHGIVLIAPNLLGVQHTLERLDLVHALVEKVRIDFKTGIVSRSPISASNLEFATINPSFLGKKNKYVYAGVGDPIPKISGVVKLDVTKGEHMECTVAGRMFGPGCYGGEPFFVARKPENVEIDEDDGYIVSFVYDEKEGESKFLVMDAKSSSLDIVASVKLPRRVPYGFHGLFVREKDLNKL